MSVIEQKLEQLQIRLQRIEDELAIRNLITRYGLAVDCGDTPMAVNCHTEQAIYRVSAPRSGRDEEEQVEGDGDLLLRGRGAIEQMLESELHQSLLPNCAHTAGPVTLDVDGTSARASGYSRLYRMNANKPGLMRLAINEWRFEKHARQWFISYRESRVVGSAQAVELLKRSAFDIPQNS